MPPRKSVLIVDDSTRHLHVLEDGLRRADRSLGIFALPDGGERVLERLACAVPDLIVLDRSMPVGGFRTLELIRAEARFTAVAVIMVSGSDDADHIAHARHVGADGYMPKPPQEDGYRLFAARLVSWSRVESWRAPPEKIVPSSCVVDAHLVPRVDRPLAGMTTRSAIDIQLAVLTAACDRAEITVRRALAIHDTDKILDAKRRLVVRYLMTAGWSDKEVADYLPFSKRYMVERRAENVHQPLSWCAPRALALE